MASVISATVIWSPSETMGGLIPMVTSIGSTKTSQEEAVRDIQEAVR